MMISPFSYVQDEIVGKSKEEMLSKIRGLKQEIGKLKKKAENMADDEIRFCPSYETQIKVMRDYLDLAIFEYEKAGGKYEMSVREKRAAAFDKDIYDGTQWELVIEYENRRNRTYEGSNKFPYNFDELLEVMEFVMK